MTAVKMQASIIDSMVKTSSGKGDSINENQCKQDGVFSEILAMQSRASRSYAENSIKAMAKEKSYQSEAVQANEISLPATTNTKEDTVLVKPPIGTENAITKMIPDTKLVSSTDSDDVNSEIEQYVNDFREELQKLLGISDKEFTELLEKSGLTIMDLLNPANLQELILNQFDVDSVTVALVNEPLANALQEGLQALSKLKEQIGQLTGRSPDQITPEMLTTVPKNSGDKVISAEPTVEDKVNQSSDTDEVLSASTDKELTVIVEKEPSASKNNTGEDSLDPKDRRPEVSKQAETKTDFVDYFASKINQAEVNGVNQTVEPVNVRSIITQIVSQIKLNISETQTSMQMLLNPEHLGHVELLVAHKEGIMTARFTVENHIAKEALESSLNILKQNFEEQGLKVTEVEVSIGNYSDGFTRDEGNGQAAEQSDTNRKSNFRGLDYGEEPEEAVNPQPERTNYNGTVEYTA